MFTKDILVANLMFQYFGFPPRKKHDGLEDARMEAEVLRKIMPRSGGGRQMYPAP